MEILKLEEKDYIVGCLSQLFGDSMQQELCTLYVLDDEPFVRRLIEIIARGAGYPVQSFSNAVDFLKVWSPKMTGCVITDLHMPTLSGLELVQRLRQLDCQMPVILLSASSQSDLASQAIGQGAFSFLLKPLEKDNLLAGIAEAMEFAQCHS